MGSFPGCLDFRVAHQLLTASQPDISRDNALMGSKHQHLVFQMLVFRFFHIPALIEIAPVHTCEIGSVIDNDRPLAFEKFIHIKVCLHIDGVAEDMSQCRTG